MVLGGHFVDGPTVQLLSLQGNSAVIRDAATLTPLAEAALPLDSRSYIDPPSSNPAPNYPGNSANGCRPDFSAVVRVQNQIQQALASGNFPLYFSLVEELERLQQCSSSRATANPARAAAATSSLSLLGPVLYVSNTAGKVGICDVYKQAPDGKNGFLAKNSDHSGSVYLTPGYGYSNGRILNLRNEKVIEQLKYTGIANGGRGHFRSPRLLPRGKHIFAADLHGSTHCWRITSGGARVD